MSCKVREVALNPSDAMDLKKLKNTEVVKLCAEEPSNEAVWSEFCSRFHSAIQSSVYRECSQIRILQRSTQSAAVYEDLVQEVYLKLVGGDCRALREFKGSSENSIYLYLGTIARNVVLNHLSSVKAKKRDVVQVSLDSPLEQEADPDGPSLESSIRSRQFDLEEYFKGVSLRQEIEGILSQVVQGKNRARDKLIVKLAIYEGFSAEEIAQRFPVDLSAKGVANTISRLKQLLQQALLERMMLKSKSLGKGS
jgi:RNA polymerase sigma factor (sigma-70 family)